MSDFESPRTSALADIARDPRLSAVFDRWECAGAAGALPSPRDFDPTALPPPVLPYLTVLDVIDGGERFRVRLAGTASVASAGGDFTGKHLDEVMPKDLLATSLARYRDAISHRRPVLAYGEFTMADEQRVRNLLLALPLSSDGRTVDRVLLTFSPKAEWLAREAMRDTDRGKLGKPIRWHLVL